MQSNIYIHPTATIDDGANIGSGTKIWHYTHVMPTAVIGQNCVLGQNVFVGSEVRIGNGCKVQNNVSLYTGVELAKDVFIGPSVVFTNVINPRAFIERKEEFLPTYVGQGASIGANTTIRCGVTIGEYAMIGAAALITKDVPAYALMVGQPARWAGWRSKAGQPLHFIKGKAICPESGEAYQIIKGEVTPC